MTYGRSLAALLACTAAFWGLPASALAADAHDGLEPITLQGVDLAFARPGAVFADYTHIRLDPVEVSFDRNWNPTRTGSYLHLRDQDREQIRAAVARIARERFSAALLEGGRYTLAERDGADVLRVRIAIVDLYVTAPDTLEPGRNRVYTLSAGEATLRAELIDSASGTVLARLVDRREARNATGRLELSGRFHNEAEAERVADAWARILRHYLDAARSRR